MRCFLMTAAACTLIAAIQIFAAEPSTQPAEAQLQTRPASGPADGESASAEVLSVQIVRPMSPELARAAGNFRRNVYNGGYNPQVGADKTGSVDLIIAVHVPDRNITGAGEDALQIATFIDDKYVELGHGKRDARNFVVQQPTAIVTEDRHACVFSISSERAPSDDASRLLLRGTVAFRTARGEKTTERQKLSLRLGRKIEVGPIPLTLRSVADSGAGLQVGFGADGSIERVRSIQFFGADGKEIGARLGFRNDSGQGVANAASMSYTLPVTPDEVEVQVNYWEAIESVKLPIEVQADLGIATIGKPTTAPAEDKPARGARAGRAAARGRVAEDTRTPDGGAKDRDAGEPAPAGAQVALAWPARERAPFPTSRPAANFGKDFPTSRPAFPPPPVTAFAAPAAREAWPTSRPGAFAATTQPAILASSKVDVISLSVNKTPSDQAAANWDYRPDFLFRDQGGTVLRLLASTPDCALIDLDPGDIIVDRFVDDTGGEHSTTLSAENRATNRGIPFAPFGPVTVSTDGHRALFRVALDDVPNAGATRLAISGTAAVRVGVNEQTSETKDAKISAGTVIRAGSVSLTIGSIASGIGSARDTVPPGEFSVDLLLTSPDDLDLVRKIEMFDADGRAIRCNVTRPFESQPDGRRKPTTHSLSCVLSRDVEKATVKVTYFDRIDNQRLPFHVVTGVGLGKEQG